MELRHLRYFVAVAEELSFSRAAAKLRLAQPSLTRQIKNLEDEIAVLLFDRSRNPISLTAEGNIFLKGTKNLLAVSEENVRDAQRASRNGKGGSTQLNIGYLRGFLYHGLRPALGAYRRAHPHISLNLFEMQLDEQVAALKDQTIDLAFVGAAESVENRAFRFERVATAKLILAVSWAMR